MFFVLLLNIYNATTNNNQNETKVNVFFDSMKHISINILHHHLHQRFFFFCMSNNFIALVYYCNNNHLNMHANRSVASKIK